MKQEESLNYQRIARVIEYIQNHYQEQPSLEELAAQVHLSPFHFQRLFRDWAGTSPKKFLQYTSLNHAKKLLAEQEASLAETAFQTGLSGTSRLHDLFINIQGMSPAEYKRGGENLNIHYSLAESPFGQLIVASTPKGLCYLAFAESDVQALEGLKNEFPRATFLVGSDLNQERALRFFRRDWTELPQIKLHLKGTEFQLQVWEALLKIPSAQVATYGTLASQIGKPKASRAVGTAIGSNPIAYLIPCHRVIRASGELGGYRWDPLRKRAILGWEAAEQDAQRSNN
ncbi:methylated-DNA--[protein]-cysteine S-methyltransferase [Croceimicrobium hydrocarbonivorans]|uniref:methylated-DNA--[protein]-cysteine S-methyltransferase n=1 Tax=Croceimicrobium hydrocarbonivorans TaxID=2761580 RepID=A0A7H0VIB9_9FLAO|nr:methylated-DNA--[protein]-cysteine S-methyltransferase [Croceimicrobium hydrocarbonivorans]QNR25467.1 methylated-DNA--[protein]-cysteine S-methyltransferase [Croceimicrobium hydrocarbonivorans]